MLHYRKKRYLFDSASDLVDLESWSHDILRRDPKARVRFHTFSLYQLPQFSSAEKTRAMLVHILVDPNCQSVFSPQVVGTFLPLLPPRLGYNTALDAAISCLCSMYRDFLVSGRTSFGTTRKYVATLGALQKCVADPSQRTKSETICASLIVQICEVSLPHASVIFMS